MKILNGILITGLILTLASCGLFDSGSGSDQKDSDPRKGSGEVKNFGEVKNYLRR